MTWTDNKPQPFEISDGALHLYRAMRALKCRCEPWPEDTPSYYAPECPDCVEWARLNRALAPLVGLPLHETCCVPPPNAESSFLPAEEEARRAVLEEALATREGKTGALRTARCDAIDPQAT
jgi:hypothetical protein